MKVINVTPGLLPIPPNGWGAVEKVIWDYHLQLQKNGIKSEIKYLNEIKYDDSLVVHVHVANLANECFNRGIPYIFTIHDHHAYLYGKDSSCFKENLMAIENSVFSTSPCKFFVPYFNSKKLRYFSHAVNTETFRDFGLNRETQLLCVANNGYAGNPTADRKGFKIAIEAAQKLDLPIIIAGPSNNKKFFESIPDELNNYKGLTKIFDLDEESLIKLYNQNKVFLHFSELEAGHPNLTLLEAMGCGLPIVGTFEEKVYKGMKVCGKSTNEAVGCIKQVLSNYDNYKKDALENAKANCYSNRVKDLVNLYSEYRESIFGNRLIKSYKDTKKREKANKFFINFDDGPKVEILGSLEKQYVVKFKDLDSGNVVYDTEVNNNMWCKANIKFFVNWEVKIYEKVDEKKAKLVFSKTLDLKNQRVKILLETQSLGDLLAYIPAVDAFQRKHQCELDCLVLNADLINSFQPNYKNIRFIDRDNDEAYYAKYQIGYVMDDSWKTRSKVDPRTIRLNHLPSYILGMPLTNERPKLSFKQLSGPQKKKYVCIATQSTAQCKYWNNKDGWETVIKFLNEKGYDVWCIDRYSLFGNQIMNKIPNGAIDKTGEYPLELRMSQIHNAEFFIGLGSGLSWLSWALGKPTILISGFSKEIAEFENPYRVINENVCNGCWNDPKETFDKGNWMWCPRNKDFECTKSITPEMVIEKINNLL